jgi:uncharacterized protein YcbX
VNFLDKRFDGFLAIVRIRSAKIDQVSRVTEDGMKSAAVEFVRVLSQLVGRVWTSEPLHVVFDEELAEGRANRLGALQRHVDAARG